MEPGFFPWYLDSSKADLMIKVLENLQSVLEYYYSSSLDVDFGKGETLLRYYSPEEEQWCNEITLLPFFSVPTYKLFIKNDILIARLNKLQRNFRQLEFDMFYLPIPFVEEKNSRPQMHMMVLMADKKEGLMVSQKILEDDDEIDQVIIGMIIDYISKHGRPSSIFIRDERMAAYIGDLCEKTGIKIVTGKRMDIINGFLKML
jgi:hypothetical protein